MTISIFTELVPGTYRQSLIFQAHTLILAFIQIITPIKPSGDA